jgi:hypothetical protein
MPKKTRSRTSDDRFLDNEVTPSPGRHGGDADDEWVGAFETVGETDEGPDKVPSTGTTKEKKAPGSGRRTPSSTGRSAGRGGRGSGRSSSSSKRAQSTRGGSSSSRGGTAGRSKSKSGSRGRRAGGGRSRSGR